MPQVTAQLADIATAQITDACIKEKVKYVCAPARLSSVLSEHELKQTLCGSVVPVRHYGSVDVFLELIETTPNLENCILVIDNNGRTDEACIGDLVALEAKHAGFAAILIWGLHRDTRDLRKIGLPVFSYGAYPSGPVRLDVRESDVFKSARFGDAVITNEHTAFIDQDGAVFVETKYVDQVIEVAKAIREREVKQANAAANGTSLRDQFRFDEFLKKRSNNSSLTFREHLRGVMSSIEE